MIGLIGTSAAVEALMTSLGQHERPEHAVLCIVWTARHAMIMTWRRPVAVASISLSLSGGRDHVLPSRPDHQGHQASKGHQAIRDHQGHLAQTAHLDRQGQQRSRLCSLQS